MVKKVEKIFDPEKYVREMTNKRKNEERVLNDRISKERKKYFSRQLLKAMLSLLSMFYIFLAWYLTSVYTEEINGENSFILYFVRFMPIVIFIWFLADRNKLKKKIEKLENELNNSAEKE